MPIDMTKIEGSFLAYILIEAFAKKENMLRLSGKVEEANKLLNDIVGNRLNLDVEFKVQGHILPVNEVFDFVKSQIDEMVQAKAEELIKPAIERASQDFINSVMKNILSESVKK